MTLAATLAGAIAGVLLAVAEAIWIAIAVPAALPPAGGTLGLLVVIVPRGFVVGAAFGLGEGLFLAVAECAARRCARGRWRHASVFAAIVATPLFVGSALLGTALLRGPQARAFADHPLLLTGLGAGVACCFYQVASAARRMPARMRIRSAPDARMRWWLVASGLFTAAAVAYATDHLVLVRLYESFHLGLRFATFGSLELAILAACLSRSNPGALQRVPHWLGASFALAAAGLGLAHAGQSAGRRGVAVNLVRLRAGVGGSLVTIADTLVQPGMSRSGTPKVVVPTANLSPDVPGAYDQAPAPGANILLVTVDALRADHLEPYGYQRATSPHLQQLARESVVVERAYTSAPHTSFALASLLTGDPAMSLSDRGLLEETPTLADFARANGYRTAAFFPPAVFFVDGERFQSFRERAFGFEFTISESLSETTSASVMTDQVVSFLTTRTPERFLIWAHYFGPHEPYVNHDDGAVAFGRSALDRYDSEVRWVDREIGRLITSVRERYPRTVVIVTADHGEEFGDHGGAYHGTTLFDEQVRVPLIVSIPGAPARRLAGPVSTTSITPTLLALVGAKVDAEFDGVSLVPWLTTSDARASVPVFAENAQQRMVIRESEKLICDTRDDACALFDLSTDPAELIDLSAARVEHAGVLRGMIASWVARQDLRRGRTDAWTLLRDSHAAAPARRDAARAIARHPDRARVTELRRTWEAESDPSVKAWLTVALAVAGDSSARSALPALAGAAQDKDDELLAHAALARDRLADPRAEAELATVLPRTTDVNLRCALMHALAKWRTPLATDTLLREYDVIRSRICCATALSTLRDPATVPFMLSRLRDEPYTPVQEALVRALATIGDRTVLPALRSLRDVTPEDELAQAIDGVVAQIEQRSGT